MIERKPDATDIEQFVLSLAEQLGITDDRRYWPRWLFHTTDIDNAVSILAGKSLLSRNKAQDDGVLRTDIASGQIIDQTSEVYRSCARLYFRPRTPTQYQNEGFRPRHQQSSLKAHSPVPIVFIFDSLSVLTRSDAKFTNGNASSSGVETGADVEFLRTIPFEWVYHDSAFPDALRGQVVFHRNAEVLIPERLELDGHLLRVFARSPAEMETLTSLVDREAQGLLAKYAPLIMTNTHRSKGLKLFEKVWTFVERVTVAEGTLFIHFNRDTRTPGPFKAELKIFNANDNAVMEIRENPEVQAVGVHRSQLPATCRQSPFIVELWLDDHIAYRNRFLPGDETVISGQA